MNEHPRVWSLQEAKAKFSEVVRRAKSEGPQTVTLHGEPVVTIAAITPPAIDFTGKTGADFWRALSAGPPLEFELPPRSQGDNSRDVSFDE